MKRHILATVIIFSCLIFNVSASSQEPQSSTAISTEQFQNGFKSCGAIEGSVQRLICYDDLAKKTGIAVIQQEQAKEKLLGQFGFWEVTMRLDAAKQEVYTLRLDSQTEVVSKSGLKRYPTLTIRCSLGNTDVFLDWKMPIAGGDVGTAIKVDYKIDLDPQVTEPWELSYDRYAVFAKQPVQLIQKMMNKNQMVIDIAPPLAKNSYSLGFTIDNIENATDILVKRCYNQKL